MPEFDLTEQSLVTSFVSALRELPEVQVGLSLREPISQRKRRGYDTQIDLRVAGKPLVLQLEARKAIFPRDVRQMVGHLRATAPPKSC